MGGINGIEHRLQQLADCHCLEVLCGLGQSGWIGCASTKRGAGATDGRSLWQGRQRRGGNFCHRTSRSACRAPAALIACRMLIMSRGLTPSELRPATRSRNVTLVLRTPSFLLLPSSIWISVRGTTVVRPWPNGLGWLTSGVSVTRIVRLPCAIATVLIRTLAPMTMVPLALSTTTLAE